MHKIDVRSGAVVSLSGVLANAGLVLVLAAVYALVWGAIRRARVAKGGYLSPPTAECLREFPKTKI